MVPSGGKIREAILNYFVCFFNIVKKAVDPPLILNIMVQFFFDGFSKKRVKVCRDKIRQNNA